MKFFTVYCELIAVPFLIWADGVFKVAYPALVERIFYDSLVAFVVSALIYVVSEFETWARNSKKKQPIVMTAPEDYVLMAKDKKLESMVIISGDSRRKALWVKVKDMAENEVLFHEGKKEELIRPVHK